MANQYGTKKWAKWARQNVEFSLSLLKEPDRQWDENTTHLESVKQILNILKRELAEVSK